jgi:hypothetical protein
MVPEKQAYLGYFRLTKECNSAMIELTANGPTVMAIQDITDRANRLGLGLGIDTDNNHTNESGGVADTPRRSE